METFRLWIKKTWKWTQCVWRTWQRAWSSAPSEPAVAVPLRPVVPAPPEPWSATAVPAVPASAPVTAPPEPDPQSAVPEPEPQMAPVVAVPVVGEPEPQSLAPEQLELPAVRASLEEHWHPGRRRYEPILTVAGVSTKVYDLSSGTPTPIRLAEPGPETTGPPPRPAYRARPAARMAATEKVYQAVPFRPPRVAPTELARRFEAGLFVGRKAWSWEENETKKAAGAAYYKAKQVWTFPNAETMVQLVGRGPQQMGLDLQAPAPRHDPPRRPVLGRPSVPPELVKGERAAGLAVFERALGAGSDLVKQLRADLAE